MAIALAIAITLVGLRARDDRDRDVTQRVRRDTACTGLAQDATAGLERAADLAERHADNGFERGAAAGRIAALRTLCAPAPAGPTPESLRRTNRLVDERLPPQALRELARDLREGRLVPP